MNAVFQLLNPANTVTVNRPLAHAIGLNEAVVYGAIVAKYYWYTERGMLDDGWFYSTAPDAMSIEDRAVASIFVRHAALAVAHQLHRADLLAAIDSRKLIGQAQGILMERYDIDDARAFAILARASQNTNVKLREIAEFVVRTRRVPTQPSRNPERGNQAPRAA